MATDKVNREDRAELCRLIRSYLCEEMTAFEFDETIGCKRASLSIQQYASWQIKSGILR